MKKKFYKRILAFVISFVLSVNMPLCGFVSYADSITSYDPALIPIFTLVSTIAIGSGIVARNASDKLNELTNNVINNIKASEVAKATSDNTYNSPYRVVGSNGQPEKPNNSNKNGKWFALGAASSLGAAVAFEKGAVEDIMSTFNSLNAYSPMSGSVGIVSADKFKTNSSSSQIALQLANISNSAVTQFDQFLHSDFWTNNDLSPDDCWFQVGVNVSDILASTSKYPQLFIRIIQKNDNVAYLDVASGKFGFYTYTNNYGSLSYYYGVSTNPDAFTLLNADHVAIQTRSTYIRCPARYATDDFTYGSGYSWSNNSKFGTGFIYQNSNQTRQNAAFAGYIWQSENPWGFTSNVYNQNQTFNTNFPDWAQEQFTLLGQNVEGIKLGIDSLNDFWNNSQENVQQGLSPDDVIAQLINNYINPQYAPDPQPDPNPNPDPDPDPDPDPEPYPEPITFPQLEEAGQSIYDWVTTKITLPDGIFDKIPFSIPYDLYLLFRSMFPTNNRRTLLRVANSDAVVQNPSHITISSTFEAAGKSTRTYSENTWEKTAPVINLDLHFKYHDVSGVEKQIDIVKTVDLKPYSYFAMILYIMIYITWIFNILGWISSSFH